MGTSRLWPVALFVLTFALVNCNLANRVADKIQSNETLAKLTGQEATPTPLPIQVRPTFTPTPNYTATPTVTATPTLTPIPTDTPTPVPTNTPPPTETPTPTNTPKPAAPPPPAAPTTPPDTPTPEASPTPSFPFKIKEQGDRSLQRTNSSILSNVILITDANGTPIGGYKLVGRHSSGIDYQSATSSWAFDALSGISGYVKQGNLKFEPIGGFQDGTWTVWLVDSGGTQVSAPLDLSYSSDPNSWAWDFIWWTQ